MQIILTNYSINTPQIAILFEVNCSYLSNKETEKQKLCPCEEIGLSLNPEIFSVLVNTTVFTARRTLTFTGLAHATQGLVLEKTPESPPDSKEIKPVNPKGNQP